MKLSEKLNNAETELDSIKSHFSKKRLIIIGCAAGVLLLSSILLIDTGSKR